MRRPVVEVLMSTYNGERYLRQQIDSILAQEDVDVRLVVRDDGSTDATLEVLAAYETDPRVVFRSGQNLGLPEAFFRLIQESGSDADFWALADQDDLWLPNKLKRAVSQLGQTRGPSLYCARVRAVDNAMRPLRGHPIPRRGPSFENAMVQNIATGCTMVFNDAARDRLRNRWPAYAVMHDAWIYLVVSGIGQVLYDPAVVVLYRQHGANAVGLAGGPLTDFSSRLWRQLRQKGAGGAHTRQNHELFRLYSSLLTAEAQEALLRYLGSRRTPFTRAAYGLSGGAHRQTICSELIRKVLDVLGRV